MKKNVIKSTLAVAILAVAGISGMKVYENHNVFNGDDLLSLNIEALSQMEGGGGTLYHTLAIAGTCYPEHIDESNWCNKPVKDSLEGKVDSIKEFWHYVTEYNYYSCFVPYLDVIPDWYFECDANTVTGCNGAATSMPDKFTLSGYDNGHYEASRN